MAKNLKKLVIVESPAKARKIGGYLGDGYIVEASVGHIRDLPQRAADIPKEVKKLAWSKEGVDIENDFAPLYVINPDKRAKVAELKELMKDADEILLATDEDREGEAIAWHLMEILRPKVPVRRMVFNEITKEAILKAVNETRDIDQQLVDAQETRRVLDRLFGYRLSPVLWKKVMPRISAVRVQSVATRLIVERERERIAFVTAPYWDIELLTGTTPAFTATLVALDGTKVATGKDFTADGLPKKNVVVVPEARARSLADTLAGADFTVRSVESNPYRSSPKAPFMTSTLQQEGGRKLRLGAAQVMRLAQGLYERGYITYMRTDAVSLSEEALGAIRAEVQRGYGEKFLSPAPRQFANKVKNAQEAHEAIRPTTPLRTPESVAGELNGQELALYRLVWQRTLASQMADAVGTTVSVRRARPQRRRAPRARARRESAPSAASLQRR